jgi:pimeloyl-ACP methyl ester carboxylesterase
MAAHTSYRAVKVDGLSIFYREAARQDRPTLLLLHGLPSSSRMFEPLLTRLAGEFHMVAPDYPGFGHSEAISPAAFAYTFDNIAAVMTRFAEALNLSRYTLYMQDYGGPVGFRMALARPDRVEALIVQNAVAHDEGLGALWKTRRAFWADRAAHEAALRANLLSLEATRMRTPTRGGRRGCASGSRVSWCSGAGTTPRSTPPSQRPIAGTFLAPRCTFSTPVTSPSTPRRTRSRRWSKPSWRPIPDTRSRLRGREDRVVDVPLTGACVQCGRPPSPSAKFCPECARPSCC